jgi:DNA end-binding protein Ku
MGARATASATISYGVLNIPVKLYLTARAEEFKMHMVTPDGVRVRQRLVREDTEEEITRGDTVRGLEYPEKSGKILTFTDEELKSLHAEKTDRIDLVEFVPLEKVSTLKVEKSYGLLPGKGSEPVFALFAEGLRRKNVGAVARWAARGREHLLVLRYENGGLVAHQMFYANEQRPYEFVWDEEFDDDEMELVESIIDDETVDEYKDGKYHDRYAVRVADAIQKKVKGEKLVVAPTQKAKVVNLADALRATRDAKRKEKKEGKGKAAAKPTPAKAPAAKKAAKKKAPAKRRAAAR